jgi:hypothetical protein
MRLRMTPPISDERFDQPRAGVEVRVRLLGLAAMASSSIALAHDD